ncbi:MAG: AzlD domain-containing protein [Nocardioides sp.]
MDASTLWSLIVLTAAATALLRAAGPVVLGGRELPASLTRVLVLLPAVLLAALVATSALAEGAVLQVDASTAGVAVGGLLLWQRRPLLLAVVAAAGVTALLRSLG